MNRRSHFSNKSAFQVNMDGISDQVILSDSDFLDELTTKMERFACVYGSGRGSVDYKKSRSIRDSMVHMSFPRILEDIQSFDYSLVYDCDPYKSYTDQEDIKRLEMIILSGSAEWRDRKAGLFRLWMSGLSTCSQELKLEMQDVQGTVQETKRKWKAEVERRLVAEIIKKT